MFMLHQKFSSTNDFNGEISQPNCDRHQHQNFISNSYNEDTPKFETTTNASDEHSHTLHKRTRSAAVLQRCSIVTAKHNWHANRASALLNRASNARKLSNEPEKANYIFPTIDPLSQSIRLVETTNSIVRWLIAAIASIIANATKCSQVN